MHKIFKASMLGLLMGLGLSAQAAVEVKFVEPEKFQDASESIIDRERTLEMLETHLRSLAEKNLPASQKLLIEVLDLNLAGQLEPRGATMDRIRVLRSVTWPSIELRYVLSDDQATLREGKVSLSDMNYMWGLNRYTSGEPLRYEKRMLDEWFAGEFATDAARKP
ncbi:DUF3016 domain-containing protein [Paucibacter sp. M5-1]|uniref:DUF3016 domain-containing protein n=1 Tax=Paucibacter sp. M5-1 TaxID=3015998 RepID=UPI0022B8C647|nr:DUF3016 domain-containing protein [Paucibacter sp. M5-1]MCZ7883528.1 DUF3016 domain-containing protein [Paucibacter sp. M5-1]